RIHIHADKNVSYQLHFKRSEVWTIISGAGDFLLNDKMTRVKTGDVLRIPVGSKHSIRALEDLEFIEVQQGTELVEDDILRFATSWEEILQSYVGR
ncbi:cupin domain-containing protein, partial [Salmonella enterica subsp. enterica serovar Typhi]|nr:cupin domain-containing protein [Salmonella enterica subsp. enterica serovar Typhi]